MATISKWFMGAAVLAALTFSAAAVGDERKPALGRERGEPAPAVENVPAAVRATVARESGGRNVRDVVPALQNGTTVYIAQYAVQGTRHLLVLAADGNVIIHRFEGDDGDDD